MAKREVGRLSRSTSLLLARVQAAGPLHFPARILHRRGRIQGSAMFTVTKNVVSTLNPQVPKNGHNVRVRHSARWPKRDVCKEAGPASAQEKRLPDMATPGPFKISMHSTNSMSVVLPVIVLAALGGSPKASRGLVGPVAHQNILSCGVPRRRLPRTPSPGDRSFTSQRSPTDGGASFRLLRH